MARLMLPVLIVAAVLAPSSIATRQGEVGEDLPAAELGLHGQVSGDQMVERVVRSSAVREARRSNEKEITDGKEKDGTGKKNKTKKEKLAKKVLGKRRNKQIQRLRKIGKTKNEEKSKKRKEQRRKQLRREKKLKKRTGKKNFSKCGGRSSSRTINETCITNILAMYGVYANQMKNFEKQLKRIKAKNKTSNNKGGKKGAFNKALERLVEQGGGNKSNLSCQGSTTNDGAKQLANLTTFLSNCSTYIKDACNVTVPGNMTEMSQCESDVKAFGGEFDKCKKMTGEAACDCFGNETLLDMGNKTKKCNLANESKAMVEADKKCKKAYGECRKYQEDIIGAVSSCSKSTDKLKEKAKTLTENSKNLDNAKKAVSALTSSRYRQTAHQRGRRAAPTDCAGMITVAALVVTIISENPASPQVSVYCLEIVAATGITCTDAEKQSLKDTETSMEEAAEKLDEAKEAVFEDLENQTGTTPSSTELESFQPEGVTTAAPKTRRRFENFLRGVLK